MGGIGVDFDVDVFFFDREGNHLPLVRAGRLGLHEQQDVNR